MSREKNGTGNKGVLSVLHTCAWKFFSEGEWSKNLLRGMWGGDPNVQSNIREGNFFLFFSKFLKIRSRNLQVLVAGGCGQRC